jgi:hypothetical protein
LAANRSGREVGIANNQLYCGKILEIHKGKRCYFHFHELKTESFYLRTDVLKVRVGQSPDSPDVEEFAKKGTGSAQSIVFRD